MDEESKGANVLPFGLTTDVSANALAAGSGGIPRVGLTAGGAGPGADFEQELSAFTSAEGLEPGNVIAAALQGIETTVDALPGEAAHELQVPQPVVEQADQQSAAAEPSASTETDLPVPEIEAAVQPDVSANLDGQPDNPTEQIGAAEEQLATAGPEGREDLLVVPEGYNGSTTQEQPVPDAVPVEEPRIVGAAGLAIGLQGRAEPVPAVANANASANGREHGMPFVPAANTSPQSAGRIQGAGEGERKWQVELPSELRAPVRASSPAPLVAQPSPLSSVPGLTAEVPIEGAGVEAAKPVTNSLNGKDTADLPAPLKNAVPQPGVLSEAEAADTVPTTASKVGVAPQATAGDDAPVENEQLVSLAGSAGARSIANEPKAGPERVATVTPAGTGLSSATKAPGQSALPDAAVTPEVVAEETGQTVKPASQVAGEEVTAEKTGKTTAQPGNAGTAGVQTSRPDQPGATPAQLTLAPFAASQVITQDIELTLNPAELSLTGELGATLRGGELTGAVRTESLQTPSQAQSAQVATQVAAEIARNLNNGNTRFQMRFDPPELGRVDVNMKVAADGSVQAHLIVERPETLDMFMRDQRGLERALEQAGLNANSEDLQFSLKQDNEQGLASGDDQSAEGQKELAETGNDDLDVDTEEIIRLTLAEQRGGLDVKI